MEEGLWSPESSRVESIGDLYRIHASSHFPSPLPLPPLSVLICPATAGRFPLSFILPLCPARHSPATAGVLCASVVKSLSSLPHPPFFMTTELIKLASGTGVSAAEVSKAIKSMHNQGAIRFDPGSRNRKFWSLVEPARNAGQAQQVEPLSLPEPAGQVR